jgi:hypothetical protein
LGHFLSGQPAGQTPSLLETDVVQAHVDMALEPEFPVPIRFAVAQKNQFGHAAIIRDRSR